MRAIFTVAAIVIMVKRIGQPLLRESVFSYFAASLKTNWAINSANFSVRTIRGRHRQQWSLRLFHQSPPISQTALHDIRTGTSIYRYIGDMVAIFIFIPFNRLVTSLIVSVSVNSRMTNS
jgi:hypothetical protein